MRTLRTATNRLMMLVGAGPRCFRRLSRTKIQITHTMHTPVCEATQLLNRLERLPKTWDDNIHGHRSPRNGQYVELEKMLISLSANHPFDGRFQAMSERDSRNSLR